MQSEIKPTLVQSKSFVFYYFTLLIKTPSFMFHGIKIYLRSCFKVFAQCRLTSRLAISNEHIFPSEELSVLFVT